jgi:hypothetical protein
MANGSDLGTQSEVSGARNQSTTASPACQAVEGSQGPGGHLCQQGQPRERGSALTEGLPPRSSVFSHRDRPSHWIPLRSSPLRHHS